MKRTGRKRGSSGGVARSHAVSNKSGIDTTNAASVCCGILRFISFGISVFATCQVSSNFIGDRIAFVCR
jgi:hypothetical protein